MRTASGPGSTLLIGTWFASLTIGMMECWNIGIMGWRPYEAWADKRLQRKEGSGRGGSLSIRFLYFGW